MNQNIDQTIEDVFSLYDKFGNDDYIGEPVSQLEHMSQAAQLAMDGGHPDEVVLAAFFHDIGHLCASELETESMNGFGVHRHEAVGGKFLRAKGFPENVARLTENHVQAKRYLTFRYPAYFAALSEASKVTLQFQGGQMNAEEAKAFEKDSLFEYSILLRRWDEQAKEIKVPVMDLEILKAIARRVLIQHQSSMP